MAFGRDKPKWQVGWWDEKNVLAISFYDIILLSSPFLGMFIFELTPQIILAALEIFPLIS